MAELSIMGPFEGPGEKRTAEHLAAVLPASWHVIPNRKLPNATSDDVDIWVIGENRVFIVEEKSWGPTLVIGGHLWTVVKGSGKFDDRSNAFNSVSAKARKAATWLKTSLPKLQQATGHVTLPIVVLSHPNVEILEKPGYEIPDNVFALKDAEEFLKFLDSESSGSAFADTRTQVISRILDLETLDQELSRIGDYQVLSELQSRKGIRVFEAENANTGESALLKCYEDSFWASVTHGAESYINREILAMSALAEVNRSWRYHPTFHYERKAWTVVPVIKPKGIVSLAELSTDTARDFYKLHAAKICEDAFLALDEVHSEAIFHKALTPSRIWIGRKLRVIFSDFYLSHVEDNESIVLLEEDEPSVPFRDLVAAESLEFADKSSDVYALAYSLASWLTGFAGGEKELIIKNLISQKENPVFKYLLEALDDDRAARPSSGDLASNFANLSSPKALNFETAKTNSFEIGGLVIGQRFEILEKLGRGGVATTWKVRDREADGQTKVLKQLHDESYYGLALAEHANANKLDHPGCSKTREVLEKPSPGFLVSEFVPGITLFEKSKEVSFGISEARSIARQCLEILQYIHNLELVHGDISSRNVIVGDDLKVTLIDFGLLVKFGAVQMAGTRATLAPEATKGKPLTAQSDFYSLGATLVQVLLGRPPYEGNPNETKDRDFSLKPLTDIERAQWGEEGAALIEVFLKAASPEPAARQESAEEMLREIQRARPTPIDKLPKKGTSPKINPTVASLRSLYTRSEFGSSNALGIGSEFAKETYIPTKLDTTLISDILLGQLDVVILTGNPGDGKTSFLQQLADELLHKGAQGESDSSGWKFSYQGRTFHAIYDASESHDALSSDELVESALSPVADGNYTALLAVNDGRLRQFFMDNEERYPAYSDEVEDFFKGEASKNQRFAIVDLKMRSIVSLAYSGIALEILDSFTKKENWAACQDCFAKFQCPSFNNAESLAGPAREKIGRLILTSHLKRTKRATLRQIRSTMGWLITADTSCEDVHEAVERNEDLFSSTASLGSLVFGGLSDDALIQEWSSIDPGSLLSPKVDRVLASVTNPGESDEAPVSYEAFMRNLYLGIQQDESLEQVEPSEAQHYKYLEEYISMLKEPAAPQHKNRLLKGVSRLIGAYGYDGTSLVISQDKVQSSWAVLKPFDSGQIDLVANSFDSRYVEFAPDYLVIRHSSGAQLRVSLDTAEVILRAADGEVYGGKRTESIRFEVDGFGKKLLRQLSANLVVVEPSGVVNQIQVIDQRITLITNTESNGGH